MKKNRPTFRTMIKSEALCLGLQEADTKKIIALVVVKLSKNKLSIDSCIGETAPYDFVITCSHVNDTINEYIKEKRRQNIK